MHPLRMVMLPLRRLRAGTGRVLGEAPVLFLAVVIGVALTFRVAIGWARSATADEPATVAATAATAPSATLDVRHEPPPTTAAGAAAAAASTGSPRQAAATSTPSTATPPGTSTTRAGSRFARPATTHGRTDVRSDPPATTRPWPRRTLRGDPTPVGLR